MQCRCVATRYDKIAVKYLALIKLASIRIWLNANESMPWPSALHAADGAALRDQLSFHFRVKNANTTQKPMIAAPAIINMISVYMTSSR
jgi:hypothetical protein